MQKISKLVFCCVFLLPNLAWSAKKFVYCSEGSPTIFNPQLATDGATNNATHPVYSRLLKFKPGTTKLMPSLAVGWEISKDQKQYIFTLRQNVQFHSNEKFKPSRPLNVEDVLFSFNRQRLKSNPYHDVSGRKYEYFYSTGLNEIIESMEKKDDYTIQFTLTKPDATFLSNLAMSYTSILSKEYADFLVTQDRKNQIDMEPIGTGPFVFKKYVKDSLIQYEAFEKYFEGKPKLDELVFSIHPDAHVRANKILAGECHMIAEPPPSELSRFENDPNLKVMKRESMNVGYLAFNTSKKPFDQKEVREAIYHALDRKSYVKEIYQGLGVVAKNPLPPGVLGYAEDIFDYDYNTLKTKNLLEKAGYKDGFTTELWALPVSRPYNPNGKKMAEMMQSDLAKVGIKAKIVTFDWPTYLAKTKNGEHTMCQLGWSGDTGDPDNFLYTLLSCDAVAAGSNVAHWCNQEFNQLVWDAKTMADPEVRVKKYHKAQEIFKEEIPWVPIAHSQSFRVMQKSVIGFTVSPINRDVFTDVDLKETPKK